jgi:hypothetical protein
MHARNALCTADRHSFQKKLEAQQRLVYGQPHFIEPSVVRFQVRLGALAAAVALKAAPIFPESFAFALAVVAGHRSLPFPRDKPIM